VIDQLPTQGAVMTVELTEAEAAADAMATRRLEEERYAYFAEASLVLLDLPDAVFRGYEGDTELLGSPREDDLGERPWPWATKRLRRVLRIMFETHAAGFST